jgi:hypothetical protein
MTPIASELQEFERGLSSYKFDSIESIDDQLTNDSIALLGRLQQHLIKIELQIKRNDKDGTIQTASLIVSDIIDFLISQLGEQFVTRFQEVIAELSVSIQSFQRLHHRGFWSHLFNIKSIDPQLSQTARVRIGEQLCSLINEMLISIIPELHDGSCRLDWWNSSQIFVEEFRRQW